MAEYNALLDNVRALPDSRAYRNSTSVVQLSGVSLTPWDVITGAIIANLNTLLIGERGEGKTQILNELRNRLFGGRATYIRMRDDLRARDLYQVYDLEKLFAKKGTTTDAKELTRNVGHALTVIDEINRAHEKIQNQVFDIYDGYIIFEGSQGTQKVSLGIPVTDDVHFHSAVATANIGAERYSGTSPIDPALLDRSHLILNVDSFPPTTLDDMVIIADTRTPKIVETGNGDHTQDIVDINRGVMDVRIAFDGLLALLYIRKGLASCIHPKNAFQSKLPVISSIPRMCEGCDELGSGCGYMTPASTRTIKATTMLAKGLKVVADAKSDDETKRLRVNYQDILAAFKLIGPYSGILDQRWVEREYLGSQQLGIDTFVTDLGKRFAGIKDRLKQTFMHAKDGVLSAEELEPYTHQWKWYADLLRAYNRLAKEHGDITKLEGEQLQEVLESHPEARWLQ